MFKRPKFPKSSRQDKSSRNKNEKEPIAVLLEALTPWRGNQEVVHGDKAIPLTSIKYISDIFLRKQIRIRDVKI